MNILFPFYGGKFMRSALYPLPRHTTISEPFAGSAGYSLRYHSADVRLNDADPVLYGLWDFLIRSSASDILHLPLLDHGDDVRDLGICQEARWFIGFWVNPGSAVPKNILSSISKYPPGHPAFRKSRNWCEAVRERVASQVHLVSHWKVSNADYRDLPDIEATWFIDPPYQVAGSHYRLGRSGINYEDLARWSLSRRGQQIVCESAGANWLPFRPLYSSSRAIGNKSKPAAFSEVIYTDAAEPVQLTLSF